jgi:hypothetical protein
MKNLYMLRRKSDGKYIARTRWGSFAQGRVFTKAQLKLHVMAAVGGLWWTRHHPTSELVYKGTPVTEVEVVTFVLADPDSAIISPLKEFIDT